jgi:hypothetical protein
VIRRRELVPASGRLAVCACGATFPPVVAGVAYTKCGACACRERGQCPDCGSPLRQGRCLSERGK